jgi:hypothetical protein
VHIALDDQTVENGALVTLSLLCRRAVAELSHDVGRGCDWLLQSWIPGSHAWHRGGQPLPITDRHFVSMDSIKQALTDEASLDALLSCDADVACCGAAVADMAAVVCRRRRSSGVWCPAC